MYSRYPDRLPEHYSGCAFRPGRADRPPVSVPDEFLLLGLILLLARSGEGSDVLPWLALLLFCK